EQVKTAFAPPRGAERAWKRGELAADIKQREHSIEQLTTVTSGLGSPRPVARRQLLIGGLAAGGVVVAGGGGTAAWWLNSRKAEENLFAYPPAADTPEADFLSEDDGDYTIGEPPKALWKRERVVGLDSPAVLPVRDVVVFGGVDGGLVAHNVVDGKKRWAAEEVRRTGRFLSLSDRLIAAVDDRGTLRTYVASTGEPKWTVDAGADALLAADAKAVYLVTKDGELRSVRRSDAKVRWTAPVPRPYRKKKLLPPGIAAGGRLVVSTDAGDVLAVDTEDGSKAWEIREQSNGPVRPARWRDTVYINGDSLTARALTDGKEQWTKKERDPWDRHETWGPPIAYPTAVYSSHGTTPRCVNPYNGSEVWDSRAGSMIGSPLAVQGRTLWSIDEETFNQVNTVETDEGFTVWNYPLPEAKRPRWLVGGGNRVFVMNDHALYALPVA
ncbi:MAG TPA: PQQ-binding-like beta-propeller repeat protein, partial [Streptomyces sp.]|nr:PQQ-binding-like beta-propeller repeat protein [Streptomyces sp.]